MTARKPLYSYTKRGAKWVVLKWVYIQGGGMGTKVAEFTTREEAQAEMYRLNGWKGPTSSTEGGEKEKEKAHGRL